MSSGLNDLNWKYVIELISSTNQSGDIVDLGK